MIVFVTTCKGRAQHVVETLPRNLADNTLPDTRFVVLNYNSPDHLVNHLMFNYQKDLASGRLVLYNFPASGAFHMAHAKNMAARCGMLEGADILVTLDADNFTGPDFDRFVTDAFVEPRVFLCPNFPHIKSAPDRPQRGYAGRLAIRAQDFLKIGGYNEKYDTWGGEDMDLIYRLERLGGITRRHIDRRYLIAIPHSAGVRFADWPEARQYEDPRLMHAMQQETYTLANYGDCGCGTVTRNFDPTPITLAPLPTRIFGIGLHKTATNSLDAAFKLLGYDSLHWGTGHAPKIWNEMSTQGRSATLEQFYALSDLPIPLLYKELDAAYPGSKFILTVRDEQAWLKSVERLFDPRYNPTRWEWDVWPISNLLHRALYGRIDFDARTMLNRYRRHNDEVCEYFADRPEDLLVMPMPEAGWPELCAFLGDSVPPVPYPREYATKELSKGD
jgi:hypothetical protein